MHIPCCPLLGSTAASAGLPPTTVLLSVLPLVMLAADAGAAANAPAVAAAVDAVAAGAAAGCGAIAADAAAGVAALAAAHR
jgi:hypothetical protein